MKIERELIRHPEHSLRCLRVELPGFRGGLHRHGHVELTWIERGRGLRWVGSSVAPFADGDLVLLGSNLPHQWATSGAQPAAGCAATVLQFPPDWAQRAGLPEFAPVGALLARATAGLALHGRLRDEVAAHLRRLPARSALRRVGGFVEILGLLCEGASELQPLATPPAARPGAGGDAAARGRGVDRVLDWIEAHLGAELRVADAAAIAHVSPGAFARYFRREVGKSFVEYVNDARCSWAALRLLEGREPVAAIALGCGFASLSNFNEQFRRRHGASARGYRLAVTRTVAQAAGRRSAPDIPAAAAPATPPA